MWNSCRSLAISINRARHRRFQIVPVAASCPGAAKGRRGLGPSHGIGMELAYREPALLRPQFANPPILLKARKQALTFKV